MVNFDDVAFGAFGLEATSTLPQDELNKIILSSVNEAFSTNFVEDDVWSAIMRFWEYLCETKSELIADLKNS